LLSEDLRLKADSQEMRMEEGTEMYITQPELARAIMDLRVEEARSAEDGARLALATGKRLLGQAGLFLAQVGVWLVSLGEHLAQTIRTQPST
jgi:hypothetical protein